MKMRYVQTVWCKTYSQPADGEWAGFSEDPDNRRLSWALDWKMKLYRRQLWGVGATSSVTDSEGTCSHRKSSWRETVAPYFMVNTMNSIRAKILFKLVQGCSLTSVSRDRIRVVKVCLSFAFRSRLIIVTLLQTLHSYNMTRVIKVYI